MILKPKKKWKSSLILSKVAWTLVVIAIYMLGRMLPIPTVALNQEVLTSLNQTILNNFSLVTGAQFSRMTLFTLGLSPYMTTLMLWRFLTIFRHFKEGTSVQFYRYQMVLSLFVAFLQSFGITVDIPYTHFQEWGSTGLFIARLITIFILTTGSFVLVWLGTLNTKKGFGGMTVIILVNMISSFQENLFKYVQLNAHHSDFALNIAIFLIALIVLVQLTVRLYQAEYRIPIKRIGINNAYNEGSYLPIRVTPAGAMPFMYGMTMMTLPPYLIRLFLYFFPNHPVLHYLETHLGLSQPSGVMIYMIILYILAIGFTYYNYDTYEIAKNMRDNGDYIENVRPGQETRHYLASKVNILAQFGALTVLGLGGLPFLWVALQQGRSEEVSIALLISNVYIIATLLLGVIEQMHVLNSWKKYKNLI